MENFLYDFLLLEHDIRYGIGAQILTGLALRKLVVQHGIWDLTVAVYSEERTWKPFVCSCSKALHPCILDFRDASPALIYWTRYMYILNQLLCCRLIFILLLITFYIIDCIGLLMLYAGFVCAVPRWEQVIDFENPWEPKFRETQWMCRVSVPSFILIAISCSWNVYLYPWRWCFSFSWHWLSFLLFLLHMEEHDWLWEFSCNLSPSVLFLDFFPLKYKNSSFAFLLSCLIYVLRKFFCDGFNLSSCISWYIYFSHSLC